MKIKNKRKMFDLGNNSETLFNNCCIDINGESLPIINGYVTDPVTKARTKVEFFYLSDCEKMVHVDFDDALEEINYSLKHHKCKKSKENVNKNNINDDNYFVYMRQKIEDLHKKIDDMMSAKEDQQRLSNHRNESRVIVDVHRSDEDTSTNMSSASDLKEALIKTNESFNIKTLQQSIHRKLNQSVEQALVRENNHSETSFYISVNDLGIISKWANNNTSFLPYKGMSNVPRGTFDRDDNYLIALLCALNPVVVLQQILSLDSQRPNITSAQVESSGELSQEEFVKYLGLTQRKTYEETLNSLHSKKLRSKSSLALQNNKYNSSLNSTPVYNGGPHKKYEEEKKSQKPVNKVEVKKIEKPKQRTTPARAVKKSDYPQMKDKAIQYTFEEDMAIIHWVLSKENVNKVNGNTIWQELEKKHIGPVKDRTWQSLRNRFLKNILSQLKEYGLHKEDVHKLISGAQRGTLIRKKKHSILKPHYGLNIKKIDTKVNAPAKEEEVKSKPELRSEKRKRHDVENHGLYSDVEAMEGEGLGAPQRRSQGKTPLAENSTYPTRSKGRKLFTQHTFVASMSQSQSIG